MAMVQRRRDPGYVMSSQERRRLETMTDEDVLAASEADPDALPSSEAQIEKLKAARVTQSARRRTG